MVYIKVIGAVCLVIILIALYKSGTPVKSFFKTALQGLCALAAVNVTGLVTGVTLSINWFTLLTVTFFGIPSAIMLTVLKFIFK